ncbi:MAG TPA: PQQ-binding-like beta-propeller repeat protein [Pirellulales bacterium]|jgi:outer membrane protein assembly factor BamB|nr:PQQ-binding-like beta-propeller repeat protein [Pirellulales bacterium]
MRLTSPVQHFFIWFAAIGASCLFAANGSHPLFAADWPQWRGPQRDGISHETGLLKKWPKDGPKLIWQVKDVGSGYSTPSVVNDRIYLLGNEGMDNEFVAALEVKDGSKVWTTGLGKVGNPKQQPNYPGARSTPTVDGDLLFALSSDGDLVCLQTATGSKVWQKNLRTDFGGRPGNWAYSESPLVDGDVLVCTPGGVEATIVAVNKKTGDVIWNCAVPGGDEAAYSSVVVAHIDNVKQYVQFLQKQLVGLDSNSGKLLWHYNKTAKGSMANIPTPLASEGYVYSAAGQSGGGLVKVKESDGAFTANEVYFSPKLPTSIGGSVKIGDYLYGTNGKTLMCVDFNTGDIKWSDRSIGAGAVFFADGLLYLHGENGDAALVEAKPDDYHEKGRFTPSEPPDHGGSKAWAYPVVANGRLYLRDMGTVWCYDVKDAGAGK